MTVEVPTQPDWGEAMVGRVWCGLSEGDGIMLRSKASLKVELMEGMVPERMREMIPVMPVAAAWQEEQSQWTASPALVAISKAMQVEPDVVAMVDGVFGGRVGKENLVVSIANDVMLEAEDGTFVGVHNKPQFGTREELFGFLEAQLSERATFETMTNYLKFRAYAGEAVYCVRPCNGPVGRGVAGVVEIPFWVTPLTRDELGVYVYGIGEAERLGFRVNPVIERLLARGFVGARLAEALPERSLGELLSTNMGCMWEHPVLNSHIELIDHRAARGEVNFESEMARLLATLGGGPAQRSELITRAVNFSEAHSKGGLSSQVNTMLNEVGGRFPRGSAWDQWQGTVA